jgi:hypothetical protein
MHVAAAEEERGEGQGRRLKRQTAHFAFHGNMNECMRAAE